LSGDGQLGGHAGTKRLDNLGSAVTSGSDDNGFDTTGLEQNRVHRVKYNLSRSSRGVSRVCQSRTVHINSGNRRAPGCIVSESVGEWMIHSCIGIIIKHRRNRTLKFAAESHVVITAVAGRIVVSSTVKGHTVASRGGVHDADAKVGIVVHAWNAGEIHHKVVVKILTGGLIKVSARHSIRTVVWIGDRVGQNKRGIGTVKKIVSHVGCRPIVRGIEHTHFGLALSREIKIEGDHNVAVIERAGVKLGALRTDGSGAIPAIVGTRATNTPANGAAGRGTAGLNQSVRSICASRRRTAGISVVVAKTQSLGESG